MENKIISGEIYTYESIDLKIIREKIHHEAYKNLATVALHLYLQIRIREI